MKTTKNLSIYKITNWLCMKDIPPSHRHVVHFLSISSHTQAETMSPQGDLALLDTHYPHLVAQNIVSIPTTVPIHHLSSPQPTQPKEWDLTSLHTVPQAFPLPSRDPTHFVRHESQRWGIQTLSFSKSVHSNLHKDLEPFPQ
jgi:hypothetical protein